MSWTKYRLTVPEDAEETVSWLLSEHGIDSVEMEGHVRPEETADREIFQELAPVQADFGGKCTVIFYAEEGSEAAVEAAAAAAMEELAAYGFDGGELTSETVQDEDWINRWKEFFHAFAVEDVLFVPTWEELPEDAADYRFVVRMDPGIAFGTGKHETTQLCIRRLLEEVKPQDRVFDVGFGSGVLSVVALLAGASFAGGTDIDPFCTDALADNMAHNGLSYDPSAFVIGDLTTDAALRSRVCTGDYDIVCANLLADIILPMIPALWDVLRPGGELVTSGIIDFKEETVAAALEAAGFAVERRDAFGEWRSITARKPEAAR